MLSSTDSKWLAQANHAGWIQIPTFDAVLLQKWIMQQLSSHSFIVDQDSIALIVQQTQGNIRAAAQLIEKLALVYPQGTHLSFEQIKEQLEDERIFNSMNSEMPFWLRKPTKL